MHDNPLFSTAADFVNNTSRHIFLTGKAGTGKTTFLKYVRENTRKKTVVVAPTGVAAINAGGVTMHSFFQLPLGPFVPIAHKLQGEHVTDQYTLFKNIRVSEEKRDIFRDLELLIIDEVSMVRCDMLDAIDAILRYFRQAPGVPFGGVQVLYIGDLFQLPPVMPDMQWSLLRQYYESPFFFHSKAVEQAPPVYIELKKIYRQSQPHFIEILNRIRNNEVTTRDLEVLNARRNVQPDPGEKYITLTTHNARADRINTDELARLDGKCFEFKGEVEGDFPDKSLPTEVVLQLKAGAQVMFIRNDKSEDRRYYNGKLATVKAIDNDGIKVQLEGSEEELLLERETWDNIRYSYNQDEEQINEEKLGSFTQYPVRLAWAITIHKSQGLTFQRAIIDAGDSFAPGQVYVALSRCTSLEGLILRSPIPASAISTDRLVLEFSRRETDGDELDRVLHREKLEFRRQELARAFDFGKLRDAFTGYQKLLPARKVPELDAPSIVSCISELHRIGDRFHEQVRTLIQAGEEEKLNERIGKAIEYFSNNLNDSVLSALDEHLRSLKGTKKIKKYIRDVRQLRNAVARKINAICRLPHGEAHAEGGAGAQVRVLSDDASSAPKQTAGKPMKGNSLRETLLLLQSGLKPSDVAARRGLALSTIEGHIALLVKSGDLDIRQCMDEEKIGRILNTIRDLQAVALHPVKEKLGDGVSYAEIRAVMSHLQFIGEK